MEEVESPSSNKKKLRQAQLPFLVISNKNASHSQDQKKQIYDVANSSFEDNEDKENCFQQNKSAQSVKDKSIKIMVEDCENMIVDLTDETSCDAIPEDSSVKTTATASIPSVLHNIEEAIETVVRRCSNEFYLGCEGVITPKENASAKKRRRRSKTISPIPPVAKKQILSEEVLIKPTETPTKQKCEGNTKYGIPEIIITSATPLGKLKGTDTKRPLIAFFEKAAETTGKVQGVKEKAQKAAESKSSRNHPPMSSVIGKKRQRSRSPAKHSTKENFAQQVKNTPSSDIDVQRSLTPSKKLKQVDVKKQEEQVISEQVEDVSEISLIEDEEDNVPVPIDAYQSPPPTSKSQNLSLLDTPSPPEKSDGSEITPKSGSKKPKMFSAEAQRKREEKEREKEEKRKQREEQRLAKEMEKLEFKRKKEEERAQKEEERKKKKEEEELVKAEKFKKLEEKRKEREKLELEKKMEKEKREEEKRKEKEKKEVEKKQKELERQKLDEDKQQAEVDKRRKSEKRAETFKSFFKSPARSPVKKCNESIGIFVPFQLKKDMYVAPLQRSKITSDQKMYLENVINKQEFPSSYLKQCSSVNLKRKLKPLPTIKQLRRKLVSLSEDGLELVEDGEKKPGAKILRAKFLCFHTNYRPPYYGTWRKESTLLSYKNPYKKDNKIFDYEFDSDDEWEEPAEGEDIANSDGEDEGEGNEEEEDDGFFVPHGYLSDDEGINEEAEDDSIKPGHKLKQKQLEFEASFKRKLSALTPIIIGCVWKDSAQSISQVHKDMLSSYKTEILCSTPIQIHPRKAGTEKVSDSPTGVSKTDQAKKHRLKAVPEEAMYDLVRLLHGNALSIARIVAEFRLYWKLKNAEGNEEINCGPLPLISTPETEEPMEVEFQKETPKTPTTGNEGTPVSSGQTSPIEGTPKSLVATPKGSDAKHEISKTQLLKKFKEIATYHKKDNMNRACWLVHDSVLEKYDLGDGKAPIPCKWRFGTDVPKIQIMVVNLGKPAAPVTETTPAVINQSPGPSIAKFVAKVSPADILEKSKIKHAKEKQAIVPVVASITPAVPSISKYTTEKLSPYVLIEKSARKIAEDIAKAKETQELEAAKASQIAAAIVAAAAKPQEGTYIIPTQEAIKTFFRIDSKGSQQKESQVVGLDVKDNAKKLE